MAHSEHRPRTLRRRVQLFLKDNWIETLFVLMVVVGLAAMIVRRSHIEALQVQIGKISQIMQGFFARFTLVDLLGAFVVLVAIAFLLWRIRVRFLKSPRWLARSCPKCGGKIERIHRSGRDRVLALIFLPHSRRYSCPNCHWTGLRHHGEHKSHRMHR